MNNETIEMPAVVDDGRPSKSLQQLATEAIAVQDACNLCGVAQAFAKVMKDLIRHTGGTAEANAHPIAKLWADKIAHLTGTQYGGGGMSEAYDACYKLAEK